jgi:hypothetical protein
MPDFFLLWVGGPGWFLAGLSLFLSHPVSHLLHCDNVAVFAWLACYWVLAGFGHFNYCSGSGIFHLNSSTHSLGFIPI